MQIHGPSDIIKDGSSIGVELNPGTRAPFVDMRIGPVRLYIDTPEECDWLIAAAAEAKRLLSPPPQGSHPYPDAPVPHVHAFGDDGCITPGCGLTLAGWAAAQKYPDVSGGGVPYDDETQYVDNPTPHSDDCDCESCITFYAERNKS